MNEQDAKGFYAETPWTWRDRLRSKLFPRRFAECPMPTRFRPCDVVTVRTDVVLSWADRLRVLVLGRMTVETRTATEYEVGQSESTSAAWVEPVRR